MKTLEFEKWTIENDEYVGNCINLLKKNEGAPILCDELKVWYENSYKAEPRIKVMLLGQYNAGKSTIIKAMTGDKDIKICSNVSTDEVCEYQWRNILIVDTPGIHSGRIYHDEKTEKYLQSTDLILFIITNELFRQGLADYFRKIAFEKQRANEIMLVLNKMSRETGDPNILQRAVQEVVDPLNIKEIYLTLVDAKDYLDGYKDSDNELMERSNFSELINNLNDFVREKGLIGRFNSPLEYILELLDKAYFQYIKNEDQVVGDKLEILRRARVILKNSRVNIENYVKILIRNLRHSVIQESESIITLYDGKSHSDEEIIKLTEKINKRISDSIEIKVKEIQDHITNEFNHLNDELCQLGDSELMKSLLEAIRLRIPDDFSFDSPEHDRDNKKKSGIYGNLSKGANKVGSTAAKVSKDTVYNFVKQLGMKFKPWGAVKLTKFIKGLGKVLGGVGVILEVATLLSSEKEKKDQEVQIRQMKTETRSEYAEQANKITEFITTDLQENIFSMYDKHEEKIRQDINKISDLVNKKTSFKIEVEELKKEINSIMKERSVQTFAKV